MSKANSIPAFLECAAKRQRQTDGQRQKHMKREKEINNPGDARHGERPTATHRDTHSECQRDRHTETNRERHGEKCRDTQQT